MPRVLHIMAHKFNRIKTVYIKPFLVSLFESIIGIGFSPISCILNYSVNFTLTYLYVLFFSIPALYIALLLLYQCFCENQDAGV